MDCRGFVFDLSVCLSVCTDMLVCLVEAFPDWLVINFYLYLFCVILPSVLYVCFVVSVNINVCMLSRCVECLMIKVSQ